MNLKGKTAIITGSTKGIGKGLAECLAEAGANVVIVSRTESDCEKTADEIRSKYSAEALACSADVTKLSDIENLVQKTLDKFGKIDILVNNAGAAITKRAEDITEADWDGVLNVDLKGVFFTAQAVGKVMISQGGGKIINIASILGHVGDRQVLPYCAAKGGVVQITKALALEWAKYNINVNALCPGYIVTDLNREALSQEKIAKHTLGKIAFKRYGQVDDLKGACLFLSSDASSYMTGQSLIIDGGWTCE